MPLTQVPALVCGRLEREAAPIEKTQEIVSTGMARATEEAALRTSSVETVSSRGHHGG